METPRRPIAAIILNWNGRKLLEEFLPRVVETSDSGITRIIVADNGSTDDSLDYVRDTFGDAVGIMQFEFNLGFADGYNRAIEEAEGFPYVVLLNSDLATSVGWDRTLLDYMETHPEVGACQPKILSYKHPHRFEYAGAAGGYIDRNGYPYCRGRIFDTCEDDIGQYDSVASVFWASGAAMMVRRELYLALGGLDTEFFAHMEEIDLCWRIHLAGYDVAAVPAAVVYHLGGGSLPAENPRKTYLNFRNNLLMLHKNLPDSVRDKALLRRRLLDTLAWAKYALSLDFANAKAIFRAHRDFARMRDNYTRHPAVDILPESPHSRRNILTEYFLHRHRTFDKLS